MSNTTCQLCPNGTYSSLFGAASNLACTWCPAGKYSLEGSSACTPCAPNTYSVEDSGSCTGCPAYSDSPAGATLAQCVCRRGYRTVRGGGTIVCEGCPAGKYSTAPNASECVACAAGKYGNMTLGVSEAGACVECKVGTYTSAPGLGACVGCSAGTYTGKTNQTQCVPCTPGRFAAGQGSSTCTNCSAGSYAAGNWTVVCTPCQLGRFSRVDGATSCADCEAGSYGPAVGGSACQLCVAGTYQSSTGAQNAGQCKVCAAGRYSAVPGLASEKGCLKCPGGSSSRAGDTECGGCPPNSFPDALAGGCVSCPRNSLALNATSADGCLCPAGFYHSYNTKAYGGDMSYSGDGAGKVYRNHVYPTGEGVLIVVKPVMLEISCSDSAGNSVVLMRRQYMPETYPVKFVDTSCRLPFVISYEVNGVQDPAETNTYFQCNRCGAGLYSDVQGSDACLPCLPGTYQNGTGASACASCGPGTISAAEGAVACEACPAERYQLGNDCQACPQGKHTPAGQTGATECVGCPPNTWSDPSSQGCQLCPAWSSSPGGTGPGGCACADGLYLYQAGEKLSCMQCERGKYSASGTGGCVPCPVGTYGDRPAAGVCPLCPAGSYGTGSGLTSAAQCVQCPPNKVCAEPGVVESCPPNTHAPPGATSMLQCVCNDGFDCTYTKSVKGKVVLPFAPEDFDAAKRQSFINAIAAAAGVSPDRVKIISVAKYAAPVGLRDARRALARTQIQVRVAGALSLKGVDEALRRFGFPRAVVKTLVSWDHHVDARDNKGRPSVSR